MSQTDIRNSNQYQQAPCENEAVTFLRSRILLPLSAPRLCRRCRRCCRVTICLSVSRVKLQAQQIPPSPGKVLNFSGSPNFSRPIRALGWSHSFKLSLSPCGCERGCMCISPTAAPGLHLIRPLFLSCPNRQAL